MGDMASLSNAKGTRDSGSDNEIKINSHGIALGISLGLCYIYLAPTSQAIYKFKIEILQDCCWYAKHSDAIRSEITC